MKSNNCLAQSAMTTTQQNYRLKQQEDEDTNKTAEATDDKILGLSPPHAARNNLA